MKICLLPKGDLPLSGSSEHLETLEVEEFERMGYQIWVTGLSSSCWRYRYYLLTFFFAILQSTLWINENGGKAYRISWSHSCCIVSVAKLCGSGCQAKYFAVSFDNLEANRSITGIPIFWKICWNTIGDNFHSEKSLL